MNRDEARRIKALPLRLFEKAVNEVIAENVARNREHDYTHAWICLFMAMYERWPERMTGEMLHSLAQDTCDISNGIEPASELAERLKAATGFDIYERPSMSALPYIPKGAFGEWQTDPGEASKGQKFRCPYCREVAYYPQARNTEVRRCAYRYCPHCGQQLRPLGTEAAK